MANSLTQLETSIPNCRKCPELRSYCADVAKTKRRAYVDCDYWGKPVPGFGDNGARIMIVGLAPAAHGANRTGRMFTGDKSGDFLYAALHRAGLANQAMSIKRDDGLQIREVYITAPLRCAPPGNKPTVKQLANCASWLHQEYIILQPKVIFCLGGIAWNSVLRLLHESGCSIPKPKPKFTHGAEHDLTDTTMLGCYHVSQQNTFTGRLTEKMIDQVLKRAITLVSSTTHRGI